MKIGIRRTLMALAAVALVASTPTCEPGRVSAAPKAPSGVTVTMETATTPSAAIASCNASSWCGWKDAGFSGAKITIPRSLIGDYGCLPLSQFGFNNSITSFYNNTGLYVHGRDTTTCGGFNLTWVQGYNMSNIGPTNNDRLGGLHF